MERTSEFSWKTRLSTVFLAAAALCLAFCFALAGTANAATTAKAKTFAVALTVVDTTAGEADQVICNKAIGGMTEENTVADLLKAAGFKQVATQKESEEKGTYYISNDSPYFSGLGFDDKTWFFWQTNYNNSSDAYENALIGAKLKADGHYQYIYQGWESKFKYTKEIPDPLKTKSGKALSKSYTVNKYNKTKTNKLTANLSARFLKKDTKGELNSASTVAALALDSLGKGKKVDMETLKKDYAKNYRGFSAGKIGKYIMALTSAGYDCTKIKIGKKKYNMVKQMEKVLKKSLSNAYDLVWVLPVYGFDKYKTKTATLNKVINGLVKCQNDVGLFGAYGYADSQTTAQAMLALDPYKKQKKVKQALKKAESRLLKMQLPDGGFAYNYGDVESNLDATANITAALISRGIDCMGKNKAVRTPNGSSPIGYIVAKADKNLKGYKKAPNVFDENLTSATVFEGLVAQKKYTQLKKPYNVYKVITKRK